MSSQTGVVGRPSIYDVAAQAGVSHTTVSRVLNGHPNIREATRLRVLAAIDELGFTRSSIARALKTNRTMRIGAFVDSPSEYGPNTTLRAVESAARRHGYAVTAYAATGDDDGHVDAGLADFRKQGVDALCVIAPRASSLDRLREGPIAVPMLVIKEEPDADLHTASVDQRAGASMAMAHLLELGHRNILHLAGPLDWFDARARADAWRAALVEAGLPIVEPAKGDWSSDSGYAFASAVELRGATAIFAANDQMALGMIHGFMDRGIRVPEDVSVVGFDDIPDARHFLPPLTTVRQDFAALGRLVLVELIAAIEGRTVEDRELIEPELLVRSSTALPRIVTKG